MLLKQILSAVLSIAIVFTASATTVSSTAKVISVGHVASTSIETPLGPSAYDIVLENNKNIRSSYLRPEDFLSHANDEGIMAFVNSIIATGDTDYQKTLKLYNWMTENIFYDYDYYYGRKNTTALSAKEVFASRYTVCEGYAELLMQLMRMAGIPCIKVQGYALGLGTNGEWKSPDLNTYSSNHAWNEAYIDGKWVILDATWDTSNRYENGQYISGYRRLKYFNISDEEFANDHLIIRRESSKVNDLIDGDFKYNIENGGATITGWSQKNSDELIIPVSLGGFPVYKINDSVFEDCRFNKIVLPDTLKVIGDKAFFGVTCRNKVVIPASVERIGIYAFSYMYGMHGFEVDPGNKYFCSIDGVLFDKNVRTLYNYPLGSTRRVYRVPNSVDHLFCTSFGNVEYLESLIVENVFTSYATYTFFGCNITVYGNEGSMIQSQINKGTLAGTVFFMDIKDYREESSMYNFLNVNKYEYGQFSDISYDKWYYGSAVDAYELGLMKGSNGQFNPDNKVTIAEVITLAARIHNIYYMGKENIKASDIWYSAYVDYALENKIIKSPYPDVNIPATRAQIADIFSRSLPPNCLKKINMVEDDKIPDVKIADKYGHEIYTLYRAGILMGDDKGLFRPEAEVTRAEVAVMVTRMAQLNMRANQGASDQGA